MGDGIEDLFKTIKYQPWFIYLSNVSRKVQFALLIAIVFILSLLIFIAVFLHIPNPGCFTEEQEACVFPFTYKGALYSTCTTIDNGGLEWCSTKTDHKGVHTKGNWGNCGSGCDKGCTTVSGPVPGESCVFPFTWQGKVYRECTTSHNKGVFWCSTQTDWQGKYIADQWGNCVDSCTGCGTSKGESCIFPFVYEGTTYTECTTRDNNNTLWCPLETDSEGNWVKDKHASGICEPGCTVGCHTHSGVSCIFPFTHNGTEYDKCVHEKNGDNGLRWCATEVTEKGEMEEGKWEYCAGGCR